MNYPTFASLLELPVTPLRQDMAQLLKLCREVREENVHNILAAHGQQTCDTQAHTHVELLSTIYF